MKKVVNISLVVLILFGIASISLVFYNTVVKRDYSVVEIEE